MAHTAVRRSNRRFFKNGVYSPSIQSKNLQPKSDYKPTKANADGFQGIEQHHEQKEKNAAIEELDSHIPWRWAQPPRSNQSLPAAATSAAATNQRYAAACYQRRRYQPVSRRSLLPAPPPAATSVAPPPATSAAASCYQRRAAAGNQRRRLSPFPPSSPFP